MKIGVLGTGIVGVTLASALVGQGNEVRMGSRSADNKAAMEWAAKNGEKASSGTFEDAAKFGEMVILSVKGEAALDTIKLAKAENFKGKTVIDTCNPLDFSTGTLKLSVCNTDSLGEQVQKALADANVVKAFNTVPSSLMTNPATLDKDLSIFVCGNSDAAKGEVRSMLKKFGWMDIIDLGPITSARNSEMGLPLWVNLASTLKNYNVAFKVVRQKQS